MKQLLKLSISSALFLALSLPLAAHEGHDHADEKKAMVNLGNAPQRLPDGGVFLPKSAQRSMGVLTQPVLSLIHISEPTRPY